MTRTRAWLREHEGLSFKDARRMAHCCDLGYWRERCLIVEDMDVGCFRLTEEGRHRIAQSCGVCRAWKNNRENLGQCWSEQRCDPDRGHAGYTYEYETCEGFLPLTAARPSPVQQTGGAK
jgi:hypothetical protein